MKETAPKKVEKVYGKVTGFAATTTTDSLGTTFSKNALEKMLDYYEKNPFVYYNHDKSQPPVAKVISQRIVKAKDF
jgi:hypothetical protein